MKLCVFQLQLFDFLHIFRKTKFLNLSLQQLNSFLTLKILFLKLYIFHQNNPIIFCKNAMKIFVLSNGKVQFHFLFLCIPWSREFWFLLRCLVLAIWNWNLTTGHTLLTILPVFVQVWRWQIIVQCCSAWSHFSFHSEETGTWGNFGHRLRRSQSHRSFCFFFNFSRLVL